MAVAVASEIDHLLRRSLAAPHALRSSWYATLFAVKLQPEVPSPAPTSWPALTADLSRRRRSPRCSRQEAMRRTGIAHVARVDGEDVVAQQEGVGHHQQRMCDLQGGNLQFARLLRFSAW